MIGRRIQALIIIAALLVSAAIILIGMAPEDRNLGVSQKIFYLHVSFAWMGLLSFLINFISCIVYLANRKPGWDRLAFSAAEIAVVFGAIMLISGSIWAKTAWGTWWTWDVRLTTALILWLSYVGYLLIRKSGENERVKVLGAVMGVAIFADVPLVFLSIRWWRSIHPTIITSSGMNMDGRMKVAFFASLVAMTVFYISLLLVRTVIESVRDELEAAESESRKT